MTWPHTGGFLVLRYEGRYTAADGGSSAPSGLPSAVHMGGDIGKELVPSVTVSGTLSVPASGSFEKGLKVVMDEAFAGASADIDAVLLVAQWELPGRVCTDIITLYQVAVCPDSNQAYP